MRYLVHHLLEAAADATPDAVAVIDGTRSVTYRELEERANRLAHLLTEVGVERGDRVALCLDKSIEALVGAYGAMKAGAAYVPLDPGAPAYRLAYIAGDCGVAALVTGTEKAEIWPELVASGAPLRGVIVMNGPAPDDDHGVPFHGVDDVEARSADRPAAPTLDADLAYILYTSGSTGQPKGVMLTHRNALAFVGWAAEEFGVGPADRLSSHAPLHFDLSVFDLYAAAWGGATLVLVPPRTSVFPTEVARFIRDQEITVWYSVPSILTMMTLRGRLQQGDFPSLRTILFAGEVFPTKYLRQLMGVLPDVRFVNLYGPTETNVCTWYDVGAPPEDESRTIPIGKAVANDEVFAVTDDGAVARPGELGELHVRGATVMGGYWGDPERTARTLVPDPSGGPIVDLVYRTGDLVQLDEEGNWRYLGRRDAQIKSRGYRIELGDVEAALNAHPAVVECAVLAVPDDLVTNRLRAYVVAPGLEARDIARFVGERIPKYMVPDEWELRPELAKTSTGKVDRQALKAEAGL